MTKERLTSLDVFRGFTILLMTIVNNPGSWASIYPRFRTCGMARLHTYRFSFPFFVFIMGTAIPFAIPTKHFDGAVFNKIMVRSLRIFCLGLFLSCFSRIHLFGLEGIPLLGVRLIIAFAVAYALLGNFSLKVKTYLAVCIFVILIGLAYSGLESFEDTRIPGGFTTYWNRLFLCFCFIFENKFKNTAYSCCFHFNWLLAFNGFCSRSRSWFCQF
jgi:predicted acyltransferase